MRSKRLGFSNLTWLKEEGATEPQQAVPEVPVAAEAGEASVPAVAADVEDLVTAVAEVPAVPASAAAPAPESLEDAPKETATSTVLSEVVPADEPVAPTPELNCQLELPAGQEPEAGLRAPQKDDILTLPAALSAPRQMRRNSSAQGCREGEHRAAFIVNEQLWDMVHCYAYWERLEIKEVMAQALTAFFQDKEVRRAPGKTRADVPRETGAESVS